MIGIIGTGFSVGEHIQTNAELEGLVENFDVLKSEVSFDSWIKEYYGIVSRAKTNKMPSVMAMDACKMALIKSKILATDIDFLILNTVSGDFKQPTTATAVQQLIGMREDSFAIELNMPCAGNIYGLATAYSYITAGLGKLGLVVGVDRMSTIIDESDFKLSGMFGDAASACIVGVNPIYSIENIFLKSKSDEMLTLGITSSGSAYPLSANIIKGKQHLMQMKGKETSLFIKQSLQESISVLLKKSGINVQSVDQLIIHQASKAITTTAVQSMGFREEQVFYTIEKYGNTSSASILLTLDHFLSERKDAQNIFLIGMGSGLNWGGIHLVKTPGKRQ